MSAAVSLKRLSLVEVGRRGSTAPVVCLRTTANRDSRTIQETAEALAGALNVTKERMIAQMVGTNFLKVPASVSDTARAAVLIACDRGRLIPGTVVNFNAGAALD
jgi:hypothetical protein